MTFQLLKPYVMPDVDYVRVNAYGYLFIPNAMFKKFSIEEDPLYVQLHVDKENKKVGLRFKNTNDNNDCRKLSKEKYYSGFCIIPALKFFNLSLPWQTREAIVEKQQDMLVFSILDLAKEGRNKND